MKERVEKLIEVTRELNKLADEVIKLLWKLGSLAGLILYLIHSITR